MNVEQALISTIYEGWHTYQNALIQALAPLTGEQLALRPGPRVRSVGENTVHIIGARARWFYRLLGEGGEAFAALGEWDRPGQPATSAAELVEGLETTWRGMHEAMARWTPEQWQQTWPGEEPGDPELTRPWVIWHLIEHDVHHGGEVSITLGGNGIPGVDL